jgi:hypothetical protein
LASRIALAYWRGFSLSLLAPLLAFACASAPRRMPLKLLDQVLFRLRATPAGKELLEGIGGFPIDVYYLKAQDKRIGNYLLVCNGPKNCRHEIRINAAFAHRDDADLLLALTLAHELAHGYQQALRDIRLEPPFTEIHAYAVALRVWLDLDPGGNRPLMTSVIADFEGYDLSKALGQLRGAYLESFESFADAVLRRYNRYCESTDKDSCVKYGTLSSVLNKDAPGVRDAWRFIKSSRTSSSSSN